MELDDFKSGWKEMDVQPKAQEEILSMLKENRHPVLKGIRKQLILEILAWLALLFCFYTMFDGDQKPLLINICLVVSVVFPLIHNLMGYNFSKNLITGLNIRESLQNYLSKVKTYAFVSVTCRLLYTSGLLLFLTAGIEFDSKKYCTLALIALVVALQMLLLSRIWFMRIKNLRRTIETFS